MGRFFSINKIRGSLCCALLVAMIVSVIHARLLYHDASSFSLQISMSASVNGNAVLYIDTGAGFAELESTAIVVKGDSQYYTYNISLPLKTIYNIRFDPLPTGGIVSISSINVVNGFGRSLLSINLDALRPAHQIESFDLKDNTLKIVMEDHSNDPQIIISLSSPLSIRSYFKSNIPSVIFQLLFGFLVVFLFSGLLIWMLRMRGIMVGFFDHPVETSSNWIQGNKLFLGVILCIFAFRSFFALTYPLDTCSDQGIYHHMMRFGYSTLIHATGYPYFMHFFSPWLPTKTDVVVFQHLIDFGVQLVLMILLKKRFGLIAAIFAGLFYGLELSSISWVSRSTPEWLQGAFFVLAFVGAMEAYLAERPLKKISLYLLSAWAFAWTVLVKFLTVILLPAYLILFILERREWKGKWFCFAAMGIIFFTQLTSFIYFYHYPSTGTKALTGLVGWTLDSKINLFFPEGKHLSESGPWSKRYCILVSEMPTDIPEGIPNPGLHGLFGHVDAMPQYMRKPYQERYRELSEKSELELQSIINAKQNLRGRRSYMLSYYFLGLLETDSLMEKVFLETVSHYPKEYLLQTMECIKGAFFIDNSYYIAVIRNPHSDHPFQLENNDIIANLPWGYARYNVSPIIHCMYDSPVFLKSGLHFFSFWGENVNIPVIFKWFLIILGTVLACIGYKQDKRFGPDILYLFMGIMTIVLLIILSNLINIFRDKEFEACRHLFCVLIGISVSSIVSFWKMRWHEKIARSNICVR
ncbi:MAG: hypothetical protein V1897_06755 [Pseudomonadota bacterium]